MGLHDLEENICPICGVHYAVSKTVMSYKRRQPLSSRESIWYCPNGHSLVSQVSEIDRLRKENEQFRFREKRLKDSAAHFEKSAATYRGHATRLRKRIKNGVCPCCNRTFINVARHMAGKHPNFKMGDEVAEAPASKQGGNHDTETNKRRVSGGA